MVDRVRAVAIACIVAGALMLAVLLAGNPGLWIGDGGWIILIGLITSAAYQVYESRQQAGRADAGTWGLAAAVGLVLAFAILAGLSLLLQPVVSDTPLLADNPVPIAILAWLLLAAGAVAWQRDPQRRAIAATLAVSIGIILGGVAALRSDADWGPIPVIAILIGLGFFFAAAGAGLQQRSRTGATEQAHPVIAAAPAMQARRSHPQASKRARRNRRR